MTYLKAAEAGAAGIDCATSCMSGGTSQPATESMVYALAQMGFDCGVDTKELKRINDFFVPVKDRFAADGTFDPYVLSTKTDAPARHPAQPDGRRTGDGQRAARRAV